MNNRRRVSTLFFIAKEDEIFADEYFFITDMSVIFFGFDGDFRVLRKKSNSDIMTIMNKPNFGL